MSDRCDGDDATSAEELPAEAARLNEDLQLGTVIATRALREYGDPARRILVRVGQPVRRKEEGQWVWVCPFQIRGIGDTRVHGVRGEDSLQVLELVLLGIRHALEATGRQFYWGDEEIGLGISRHITWVFGREIEEELRRIVERETTRLVDEYIQRRHRSEDGYSVSGRLA
jgi:hypothetical protein